DVRPQLDRHRLPVGGGLVAERKLGNGVELLVDVEQLVAERGKDDAADIGARERRIENIGILGEADPQRCLRGDDSAGPDQERGRSRKTKRLHRTSPLILPGCSTLSTPAPSCLFVPCRKAFMSCSNAGGRPPRRGTRFAPDGNSLARWQAVACKPRRSSGRSVSQRMTATGHRVWNGQPAGGCSALGISPLKMIRSRMAPGAGTGMAERSARL